METITNTAQQKKMTVNKTQFHVRPTHTEETQELLRDAHQNRSVGRIKCATFDMVYGFTLPENSQKRQADTVAQAIGLQPLGYRWLEVDGITAHQFLENILRREMAYDAECMREEPAKQLVHRFWQLFHSGEIPLDNIQKKYRAFCNMSSPLQLENWLHRRHPRTWIPATKATYDAGLVLVGWKRAAVLWIEDIDKG